MSQNVFQMNCFFASTVEPGRWYIVEMSLFMPTGRRKRTEVLSQVRVTAEEKQAVEWLAKRLSERDGTDYGISDVVRLALATLYLAETNHDPDPDGSGRHGQTQRY